MKPLDITSGLWRLIRPDGSIASECVLFRPDGAVEGYNAPDEKRWRISEGSLSFCDANDTVTTRFDEIVCYEPYLRLRGRYREQPQTLLTLERREWEQREHRANCTRFHFQNEIAKYGWKIGIHSYGMPKVIDPQDDRLIIGNYTSIAEGVSIALSNHQTRFVTTFPFSTLNDYWPSVPESIADHHSKGDVTIGSDVWIGLNAFIGSGVKIGHGAIIGAHAVVVKDVPAYAICVGNPARVVRYRFNQPTIESLLNIAWWTWSDRKINRFLHLILSENVDDFINSSEIYTEI